MKKTKKEGQKINKYLAALLLIVIAVISAWSLRKYINPILSVFNNRQALNTEAEKILVPNEEIQNLIEQRNTWYKYSFDNFQLNLPKFESRELDENTKQIAITEPETGEILLLTIYRTEANDTENVLDLLPKEDSDLYGYTILGEYDALRVGPNEVPYYEVSYFINENGYIYEINAKFNTKVSFVDQVLSSFKIEDTE